MTPWTDSANHYTMWTCLDTNQGSPHAPHSVWVTHQARDQILTSNVQTTSSRGLKFSQNLFRHHLGSPPIIGGPSLKQPKHHVTDDFKLKSETGTTPPPMSHVPDSNFI